jgi:probable rRNA maturation factor
MTVLRPPKLSVRNLQRRVPIDIADLRWFANEALPLCLEHRASKRSVLKKLPRVSVLIVSDRRMSMFHRKFLHQIGPTDVLTFEHGEIFVSAETARENAKRFETSIADELRLYIVHGLLHLHGFDDRTKAGARRMEGVQKQIMAKAMERID